MKTLLSGVYRFQNDLHLDDFANCSNGLDLVCDDVDYYGINIGILGGDKFLEYGGTSVYYQSTKWENNTYKEIFIDNDWEVNDDLYNLMNTYATRNFTLTYNTNGGNIISPVSEILNIPLLPTPINGPLMKLLVPPTYFIIDISLLLACTVSLIV